MYYCVCEGVCGGGGGEGYAFQALITVMILSFRTDMPGQTVQTQIRLLLEEQSDQDLHCLPFRLHRLD